MPTKTKVILTAEDRTKAAFDSARGNLDSFAGMAGKALGLLAAVGAGISFEAVIEATRVQERAMAVLEQRIKTTGGVAGFTAQELAAMAASMQQVTTYGDEAVMEMQALLLTFTNIRGGVFAEATEAILDMSAGMGTGLKESAIQLGKALNDPIAGISALSRVGVSFSDDSKDMIKALVESGKMAEAQRVILKELEIQFGGTARAAADTFGGALDQVSNAFGDLLEQTDGLDSAKESMQALTATLQDPAVAAGLNNLIAGSATFAGWVATAAAELANAARELGELGAYFTEGPLSGTAGLRQELEFFESLQGTSVFNRTRLFGPDGIIKVWEEDEIEAEIERLKNLIEQRTGQRPGAVIDAPVIPDNPTGTAYSVGGGSGGGGSGTNTAAARLRKQFETTLQGMQRSLASLEQTTQYERVLWEVQNGRFKDLSDQQQRALLDAAAAIDLKKSQIDSEKKLAEEQARYNESQEEAAQRWRDLLNPMESVDAQLAELDRLLAEGRISWDTYAEGVFHVQEALEDLDDKAEEGTDQMGTFAEQAARNIQDNFADFLFNPFDQGMQGMLSSFVSTIHRMVSEMLAQDLLRSFFTSMSGGDSTSFFGRMAAAIKHTGGIVGEGGASRMVSPLAFLGAPRFHGGGIPGLKSNEVPTILEEGEGVFTKDQMAAMGGGQSIRLAIFDDRSSVGDYMSSSEGEQVMLETIRRNKGTIKRYLS